MSDRVRDVLIESVVTSRRERDREGRPVPPAAWWDLSAEDREELFGRQLLTRKLERLIDPEGMSSTARAVMARIEGA